MDLIKRKRKEEETNKKHDKKTRRKLPVTVKAKNW